MADTSFEQKEETAAVSSEPIETKEKKPKKWLIPAVIAAAALAAVLVFFGYRSPKSEVIQAFAGLFAEGQANPAEEIFGLSDYRKMLNRESVQVEVSAALEGSSEPEFAALATGSLTAASRTDREQKRMELEGKLGYGGMEFASARAYLDPQQLAMEIPDLTSRVFTVDFTKDLEEQKKNSPYLYKNIEGAAEMDRFLKPYLDRYRDVLSGEDKYFDAGEAFRRFAAETDTLPALLEAVTAEKLPKDQFTMDVNGVRGYRMHIPQKEALDVLTAASSFMMEDEGFRNQILTNLKAADEVSDSLSSNSEEALLRNAEKQIQDFILRLRRSAGDLTADVYVRKNGEMAAFSLTTEITEEEKKQEVCLMASFGTGFSAFADSDFALSFSEGEKPSVVLSLSRDGDYEAGKQWTEKVTASMTDGTDTYSAVFDWVYEADGSSCRFSADFLDGDVSQFTLTADGFFEELVPGERFDLVVDSMVLETDLVTGSDSYVELSGRYTGGPLEKEISVPTGERFDLIGSDEEAYEDVIAEMTYGMFGLLLSLSNR